MIWYGMAWWYMGTSTSMSMSMGMDMGMGMHGS